MKKGAVILDETGNLIYAVIGLLVVLGVIYFIYMTTASKSYDKAACQLSVIANSKVRMPLSNVDIWRTDCPTRYVRFTKEGYSEESGKSKYEIPFKKENKKVSFDSCKSDHGVYQNCEYLAQVNEVMAEHIFDCWEQFVAGEVSVFSDYTTERQCVICTVFEYSGEVKDKFGEVYSNEILPEPATLDEFMRTSGPLGRDITYYEYTQDLLDHFNQDYYDYNFNDKYAVVFTATNELYIKTLGKQVLDFVVPNFMSNGGDYEQRFINTIKFMDQGMVSQECDTLVG
ncbi:MAG: hypothetical protein ABIJ34_00630 [archaeon]